jgi:uncharacterized membrane protein YoaK (UPF0700 family)
MPLSPRQRRFRHTLALASLLAVAAGMVNVVALEAFGALVANVTGHATEAGRAIGSGSWGAVVRRLSWLGAFMVGAAISALLMRPAQRRGWHFVYAAPLLLELLILLIASILGDWAAGDRLLTDELIALLLLAMGVQNAMVTWASGAVVRTTHLTGLLTDIGINLGRLASGEPASERRILGVRLGLQVSIVLSFVSGAAAGEAAWMLSGTGALRLAMIPILISVIYDVLLARAERLNPSQFASGGPGPSDDEPDR